MLCARVVPTGWLCGRLVGRVCALGKRRAAAPRPARPAGAHPVRPVPHRHADRDPSMASVAAELHRARAVLCRLEQEISRLQIHQGEACSSCTRCDCSPGCLQMDATTCPRSAPLALQQFSDYSPHLACKCLLLPAPHPSHGVPTDHGLTRPGAYLFELFGTCGISPATWQVRSQGRQTGLG